MATYINSFFEGAGGFNNPYASKILKCNEAPEEYKGYLIYPRVNYGFEGDVFDIVKDGVCIGMNAGPNGAKRKIDHNLKFVSVCDGL